MNNDAVQSKAPWTCLTIQIDRTTIAALELCAAGAEPNIAGDFKWEHHQRKMNF